MPFICISYKDYTLRKTESMPFYDFHYYECSVSFMTRMVSGGSGRDRQTMPPSIHVFPKFPTFSFSYSVGFVRGSDNHKETSRLVIEKIEHPEKTDETIVLNEETAFREFTF